MLNEFPRPKNDLSIIGNGLTSNVCQYVIFAQIQAIQLTHTGNEYTMNTVRYLMCLPQGGILQRVPSIGYRWS